MTGHDGDGVLMQVVKAENQCSCFSLYRCDDLAGEFYNLIDGLSMYLLHSKMK